MDVSCGESLLADLRALVDEFGWAVRHVLADGAAEQPSFSYTVRLTLRGWPELVIVGLPSDVTHAFLATAVDALMTGARFFPGLRTTALTESGDVMFIAAEDVSGMTAAGYIVGEFRALQLVWPDSKGTYPWEEGHRNVENAQPLLGPIPTVGQFSPDDP
ncbi:DUF4262 domain-containing protein [Salinibacterium sp. SYSU T00001]|uniref:DUF4262 domain-containing protein n=1 Tax=Homoserinimonas sedimenticola TaxID=2986805 RepID=UPI0022368226|nr:DUF4262 domain-containing protein [Salinibacterium sedimenticola]MCW4386470.1 DUF4262 domain-containing protein [Salinibacterium sedimenticola]